MKTKILIILGVAFALSTGAAGAQATEGSTVGGLGRGISTMVQNILGDVGEAPVSTQAEADASLMLYAAPPVTPANAPAAAPMNRQMASEASQTMSLQMDGTMDVMQAANAKFEAPAMTQSDMAAYLNGMLESDPRIAKIAATEDRVAVTYRYPGSLLGVISTSFNVTASVRSDARITVSYPWYAFVSAAKKADLKALLAEAIQPIFEGRVEGSGYFSLEEQAIFVEAIAAVFADRAF